MGVLGGVCVVDKFHVSIDADHSPTMASRILRNIIRSWSRGGIRLGIMLRGSILSVIFVCSIDSLQEKPKAIGVLCLWLMFKQIDALAPFSLSRSIGKATMFLPVRRCLLSSLPAQLYWN